MKLLNVNVHNVLKITDVDLSLEGHNLIMVGGRNGQGKSSLLTALACALCGKRDLGDRWPDILLREGESEGWVHVGLSGDPDLHDDEGFRLELFLRRKRGGAVATEFRLVDSTGEESAEPRETLKQLYSMRAFDPLEFEKSSPKDRAAILRQLLGLDFTELDENRKEAYDKRTDVNREVKLLTSQEAGIDFPGDTPDEPISASDLFDSLKEAEDHNASVLEAKAALVSLQDRDAKLGAEEERLKARLIEIDTERRDLDGKIEESEKVCADLKLIPLDSIREAIKTCDVTNMNVSLKKKKAAIHKSLKSATTESNRLTREIEAIDKEKKDRIENAEWPLPEMSMDESGVMMNNLPFEQASKAQRVIASVKVGMALNPKLRLLICQDGNDLDNETLAALEAVLVENQFQMLLEMVTRNDADEERCVVVFQDGAKKLVEASDTP